MDSLTAEQTAILDLEGQRFDTTTGKDRAIRGLGLRPMRYYQLIARLVESEAALAYAPVLVNRLRRIADPGSLVAHDHGVRA